MKKTIFSACLIATIGASAAQAQDFEKYDRALKLISTTANDLCNSPAMTGQSNSLTINGKAEIEKLLGKFVDLNIEGAAKYATNEYKGLLQKDFLPALQDSARCKERIFNSLRDKLIPTPTPTSVTRFSPMDLPSRRVKETPYIAYVLVHVKSAIVGVQYAPKSDAEISINGKKINAMLYKESALVGTKSYEFNGTADDLNVVVGSNKIVIIYKDTDPLEFEFKYTELQHKEALEYRKNYEKFMSPTKFP